MGNRAVITDESKQFGIYLHWNGGYTSVKAFLDYCRMKDYRDFSMDKSYAYARLVQVIANFFGGNLSVGLGLYEHLDIDNGDNGVYIVGKDWQIIGREFSDVDFDEVNEDDYKDMLKEINRCMPEEEQIEDLFGSIVTNKLRNILNSDLSLDEKIEEIKKVGM